MLFISHNLGLVARICDRAAVMYAGEIVETGEVRRIFAQPRHPYTAGLLRCIPRPDLPRGMQKLVPIPGQMQSHQEGRARLPFRSALRALSPRAVRSGADSAEAVGSGWAGVGAMRAHRADRDAIRRMDRVEPNVAASR